VAVNGANVSALSLERVRELMGNRSEKVVRLDMLRSQTPFQVILFWDQNRNQSHTSSHGPSSRPGSRPGSTMVYTSNRSNLPPNTWIAPPPGGGPSHSLYATAPVTRAASNNSTGVSLCGVGLMLEENQHKEIVIRKVKPGSNADRTRMFQEGDVVLAVGEESVLHRPLDWVKSRILGKPATTVLLTMKRADHAYTMVVLREGLRPAGEWPEHGYASPPPRFTTGLLHQTSSYHPVGQPSGFDGSAHNLYVTSPVKILEPPGYLSPGAFKSVVLGSPPPMSGVHTSPLAISPRPLHAHPQSYTHHDLLQHMQPTYPTHLHPSMPHPTMWTSESSSSLFPHPHHNIRHVHPWDAVGHAIHPSQLPDQQQLQHNHTTPQFPMQQAPGNSSSFVDPLQTHTYAHTHRPGGVGGGHVMNLSAQIYSPPPHGVQPSDLVGQSQAGHILNLSSSLYSPMFSPAVAPSTDPQRIKMQEAGAQSRGWEVYPHATEFVTSDIMMLESLNSGQEFQPLGLSTGDKPPRFSQDRVLA